MRREEVAALGLLWEHDPGRLEDEHWAEPVAEVAHQAEHVDGAVRSVGDVGEVLLELVEQELASNRPLLPPSSLSALGDRRPLCNERIPRNLSQYTKFSVQYQIRIINKYLT